MIDLQLEKLVIWPSTAAFLVLMVLKLNDKQIPPKEINGPTIMKKVSNFILSN